MVVVVVGASPWEGRLLLGTTRCPGVSKGPPPPSPWSHQAPLLLPPNSLLPPAITLSPCHHAPLLPIKLPAPPLPPILPCCMRRVTAPTLTSKQSSTPPTPPTPPTHPPTHPTTRPAPQEEGNSIDRHMAQRQRSVERRWVGQRGCAACAACWGARGPLTPADVIAELHALSPLRGPPSSSLPFPPSLMLHPPAAALCLQGLCDYGQPGRRPVPL